MCHVILCTKPAVAAALSGLAPPSIAMLGGLASTLILSVIHIGLGLLYKKNSSKVSLAITHMVGCLACTLILCVTHTGFRPLHKRIRFIEGVLSHLPQVMLSALQVR